MLPPDPVSSYLTFSPLPLDKAQGGFFLLHYYTFSDIFPLGNMVLCVARTFLSANRRIDETACCCTKVLIKYELLKTLIVITFDAVNVTL